MTGLGQSVSDH